MEVPVSDEVGLGHDGVVVVVVDFGFPNDKVWIVADLFAGNDPCILFCKTIVMLATLTKIKTSKLLRRKVDGSLKIGCKRPAGSITERYQEFTLG